MTQFNLYVHGVPIGHEVCPRDAEEDYLKDFYSHDKEIKETSYMQIDIVNGKSFYTYLHKKNVSSEIGRPGSYLGLTVCFSKQFCTNVHMLYEILETIYQKICIGCLIKLESGNERFLVKEIASAQFKGNLAVDYIKAAFRQNMEKYLAESFDDLDGFSNSVGEVKFSLKEVDSPLFRDTFKNRRILVSPEYGTVSVAYNNLLKEVEPLREEHGRFKQDNALLKEKNKSLTDEVARLEKELSNAEASAGKKYKKQLEEAQAKCDEVESEKKKLEDKIKEAASAVDLIDVPVKTLTRLLANRFPEESKKGYKEYSEPHSPKRTENPIKTWLPMVNLVLLLCLLGLCGYGCYALSKLPKSTAVVQKEEPAEVEEVNDKYPTSEENTERESNTSDIEEQPSYDDFALCKINISHYSGSGNLIKGKEYGLSVVKKVDGSAAKVPDGSWTATTNSELPGITITGNKFKVDVAVSQQTNVLVYYVVEGQRVLTRTIKVE
ncbi:MAG: hypothetical protein IJ910_03380 [Bacteroidaceae bacterium]|nr:hypothetical protein [Bacteroidaceae bacterium]